MYWLVYEQQWRREHGSMTLSEQGYIVFAWLTKQARGGTDVVIIAECASMPNERDVR